MPGTTRRALARVVASYVAANGLVLALSPAGAYRSGTFAVAFDVAPQPAWGAAMVAAGAARWATGHPLAVGALATVMATWALALAAALVTGDAESPAPFIWPACVATLIVVGAGRWDTGADR